MYFVEMSYVELYVIISYFSVYSCCINCAFAPRMTVPELREFIAFDFVLAVQEKHIHNVR